MIASGCGGDDDEKAATTSPATTAAESSPDNDAPLKIDEVKTKLEAAGYTVKEKPANPLLRNEASPGGLVTPEVSLDVTGGDLPSGASVGVYSFSAPEDVTAVKDLAAGGELSLVKGELFIQSAEPGAADTVAEAASG